MTHLLLDASLAEWSRAQFALTAMYHWLFVPLTLGLGVVVAIVESLWRATGRDVWQRATRFWMKLFGVNFAIGVATGIILEFEFGTNWSNYAWTVGDIFGAPLAIEGIVAFFLETTMIAVMFFGWGKVSPRFHLTATWLTAIGAMLSAWWILVANAWMQHPVGTVFNPDTARCEMTSFLAVAVSPVAVVKFLHTVVSGWLTGAVFVAGVSAWLLLKGRSTAEAKASMGVAAAFGLFAALALALTGDLSATTVARTQPMKLAAFEGLERGSSRAPLSIVPGVEVPGMLTLLATHQWEAFVPGTQDIIDGGYTQPDGTTALSAKEKMARGRDALDALAIMHSSAKKGTPTSSSDSARAAARQRFEANAQYFGYGHITDSQALVPPVAPLFWAFRVMVGLGALFIALFAVLLWLRRSDRLTRFPWLLRVTVATIPLAYLCGQAGWLCAELGRQPWAIQNLLPVSASLSAVPSGNVVLTTCLFAALFTLLLVAEIRIMCGIIRKGI